VGESMRRACWLTFAAEWKPKVSAFHFVTDWSSSGWPTPRPNGVIEGVSQQFLTKMR
jgi:hypothetical protein